MKNSVVLLLYVALIVISCRKTNDSAKNQAVQSDSISEIVTPIQAIPCGNHSEELLTFLALLQKDHYDLSPDLKSDSLKFFKTVKRDNKPYSEEIIVFSPNTFLKVDAKRKLELVGSQYTSKYYPSFHVVEICFENDSLSEVMFSKLEEVIYNRTDMNGKSYDFILQNGSRLIYVVTNAKIFESYVMGYEQPLKNIISSDSR